ncbi:PRC-barrel domain containing protein [Streptomyces sp. NPDC006540]|jgi:hypothetical protein|uniref:PRC-barrel domain containing protein n=1 Tax=Streptomyces sp. NPDC006540 TaxID=3155353 RepID=UPI0033B083E1
MLPDIWSFSETAIHAADMDLTGYKVEATDGGIGRVDQHSAEAGCCHLVVDTGYRTNLTMRQLASPFGVSQARQTSRRSKGVRARRTEPPATATGRAPGIRP